MEQPVVAQEEFKPYFDDKMGTTLSKP